MAGEASEEMLAEMGIESNVKTSEEGLTSLRHAPQISAQLAEIQRLS